MNATTMNTNQTLNRLNKETLNTNDRETAMTANRQTNTLRSALTMSLALLAALTLTSRAHAGEASTSASAGSNGFGPGTASATANYNGNGPGYVQTRTRSGNVSFGQGIAFGIDRNGVNFSASNAVAGRVGPAIASNFNLSIGFNGQVSGSHGLATAQGSPTRSASAGGSTSINRFGNHTNVSTASGNTGPRGTVRANTNTFGGHRMMFRRR